MFLTRIYVFLFICVLACSPCWPPQALAGGLPASVGLILGPHHNIFVCIINELLGKLTGFVVCVVDVSQ